MYQRSAYVEAVMSRLKPGGDELGASQELKGIVDTQEVRRLCGLIRELTAMRISAKDRKKLDGYARLCRCFTVAEAVSICAMYGVYTRREQKGEA